jgi:hypothetical protein
MHPSEATCAQFFLSGLAHGLTMERDARGWALGIIEMEQSPPSYIIDVALSSDRRGLENALSAVPGERDLVEAGRMLLGLLSHYLRAGEIDPIAASLKAVLVYRDLISYENYEGAVGFVYENFLYAQNENRSLLPKCKEDLVNALAQQSRVPSAMPNPALKGAP